VARANLCTKRSGGNASTRVTKPLSRNAQPPIENPAAAEAGLRVESASQLFINSPSPRSLSLPVRASYSKALARTIGRALRGASAATVPADSTCTVTSLRTKACRVPRRAQLLALRVSLVSKGRITARAHI